MLGLTEFRQLLQEKQSVFVQISFVLLVIMYMLFGSLMFMILEGNLLFSDRDYIPYSEEQKKCIEQVSNPRDGNANH